MPGAVFIRPGLAIAGDRHVDQLGIDRLERRITHTEFVHYAGAKLLQHDVVLSHQLLDHFHGLGLFQVQGDAAFIAIEVSMAGRNATVMGRQYAHQVHAAGRLDAQYLCAHIAQQQRGKWSR